MNVVELIGKKRAGQALDAPEIDWLVQAYTRGEVADYQMSAFLMAVVWRGMDTRETVELTLAMVRSGTQLQVRDVLAPVVDKHSTGGVGDKVTIAVAPLLAACGLPVAKMTGRGLGHTGGTVDKLEAISGLRMDLGREEFLRVLRHHGMAISGQSAELAPADGKMYALRDVTGTVDSIPLIASSIMSKKLAVGPSHLLLDVKVGSRSVLRTVRDARKLARVMVDIGEDAGVRTRAVLSSMEQPLGRAIGNALEVAEAVAILRGEGPEDVMRICQHEVVTLLTLAGVAKTTAEADEMLRQAIASGSGLAKLAEVVAAQGGDARQVEDPSRLPVAPVVEMVKAPRAGYIAAIDAERVGMASVRLGAGRMRKEDHIDPAVGLVLQAKVGDHLRAGQPLVAVYARTKQAASAIRGELLASYRWSDEPVKPPRLLYGSVERQ
ncbi:MAG TPA: thymidine phosphorylase [Ktedonobacterales bacterium]|jgi:pyrimidine-nucleoside phosphorylase|nr:thymidine phosphorylase [Ktedonobacterales bacterium]